MKDFSRFLSGLVEQYDPNVRTTVEFSSSEESFGSNERRKLIESSAALPDGHRWVAFRCAVCRQHDRSMPIHISIETIEREALGPELIFDSDDPPLEFAFQDEY